MATLKYILELWQNGKEVNLDIDKERSSYYTNQENLATPTPIVNANQAEKKDTCLVRPQKDNDEKSIVKEKNEQSQQEKACVTVSQVKMPPKMVRRGRPKGAEATVIGLPRKRGHDGKLKKKAKLFINKSAKEKEAFILGMLASKEAVNSALNEDKLISETALEKRVEKIPKKILDETINIFRVKKHFSNSAWQTVQSLLKKVKKEKTWDCKACDKELENNKAIGCDSCLEWYHLKCIGKREPPKTKTWICRNCVKVHATTNI